MHADIQQVKEKVAEKSDLVRQLYTELGKVVVGQEMMVSRLMVGLLTEGHVLLEGPGSTLSATFNEIKIKRF